MNRKIYTLNDTISLVEYQPCDDRALYEDWLDPETQKGYNGVYVTTFEDFQAEEIRQRFFAMIQLNGMGEIIGAVGISPPETIADLAIWVFKPYRMKGYGTVAFSLATKYAVDELRIPELHAGAYPDNTASRKMLKKCGYIPNPAGNISEKHYITGEEVVQMDYIYRPVTIRLAVPADAKEMFKLNEEFNGTGSNSLFAIETSLTNNRQEIVCVAVNGDTLAGFCCGQIFKSCCYSVNYGEVTELFVLEEYRRQGIASGLMAFMETEFSKQGINHFQLFTGGENEVGKGFYKKLGYSETREVMFRKRPNGGDVN